MKTNRSDSPIYYVYSDRSRWDVEQHELTQDISNVRCIEFRSAKHGIPFLKVALHRFINLEKPELEVLAERVQYPIPFTIKMVGVYNTLVGFIEQVYKAYKKRH